ncbi:MAG: FecR family protein [Prochlorothrix sp.]|nr:FecR family protein [Prochlorothrix sp.]
MPRLSRLLGLAGLITATLGASWTAPSLAGEKLTQARIANLRNQVNLLNADRSSQPAQLQDLLTPGKGLSTGAASLAELRFNDGSLARVGSQAVFWFVPNTRDLQLSNGTALMLIPPGQGRTRVRTPNVVAGIEGSALVVRFNPETETTSVISLTDSGIQVCMTASGDCQVLEGGQVAAVDADGLQVYQLDLETFYATSGLVEGLDLDVPPTPEELATDPLAAVREETTAVLENLTPLLPDRIVINPASFGPPAAPPADAPALGLLDPRVSFFLFPDQSGGEDVLEALNLVNVNLAGRALLDLEGLQITEDGLVGFNGRTLFELGEIQGQGAFVVTDPTIVTDPTEEPDLGPEQPFCPPGFEIATGKNPNNPNIGRGFDRAAPINCL